MSWTDELPEVLRDAPFIGKAADAAEALGKIQHAADYMGRAVKLPTEETSDEDKAKFYQKIADGTPDLVRVPDADDEEGMKLFNAKFGVPEESTDYVAPTVADWDWDDEYVTTLRGYAKEAGMNKRQFTKFMDALARSGVEQDEVDRVNVDKVSNDLKKSWGAAYDERMTTIKQWMVLSKAPDALTGMVESGNMDPAAMEWLHETAKKFSGPGGDVTDKTNQQTGAKTPLEAQEKIHEIMNDPAYFDASNPRQKLLIQRMAKYQGVALG